MSQKDSINTKALKAGLWYTVSNVLIRGINFLATPIFTRLMSKEEYGLYANYATWISLLSVLATLDLSISVLSAKFDYQDNLDQYISSVQCLGTLATGICYAVVCIFSGYFQTLFGMEMTYIHIMFLYLLVAPSYKILQTKFNIQMKYQRIAWLTIGSTLMTLGSSLFFVMTMDNKLLGRILGDTVVLLCFCSVLYAYNFLRGRCVRFKDWRYAMAIALPFIPHSLANNIIGATDKLIITGYCGPEDTAMYSLAYTCSLVVTVIASSINHAWIPWLFEKLSINAYDEIKNATRRYLNLTLPVIALILLTGPELVLFFGGWSYMESVRIIPCIMAGCYMVMLYTFFVNVEIYHKKTTGISIRTMIAGVFNLLANLLFVPYFGYEAAAYTTLASYICLFLLHYHAGIGLGVKTYYELQHFFVAGGTVLVFMVCAMLLYEYTGIRYSILVVLFFIEGAGLFEKRQMIFNFIARRL